MSQINSEFIERYEQIYRRDPNSKIFAPLAEAYRRMGQLGEALTIAQSGVKKHPDFAGGRVALAKILIDQEKLQEAAIHLKAAIQNSPENILAHHLLAQVWLDLKEPKEALKAFKMLLFLNPTDSKAQKAIKKLESLTADEFDEDLFSMNRLDFLEKKMSEAALAQAQQAATPSVGKEKLSTVDAAQKIRGLERYISLTDAFIVRNDIDKAESTLQRALLEFGSHPELNSRLQLLKQRKQDNLNLSESSEDLAPLPSRNEIAQRHKKELLESLLQRINDRRNGG